MLIKEMTPKECGDFLVRVGFGRLGCCFNDEPYVAPVYFAYQNDRLYGFSTVGQKIEWMRANPSVCVEADEVSNHFHWTSVIVRGRYQELPDTSEFASERRNALLELERRMLWWQTAYAAAKLRSNLGPSATLLYCIHITLITGRRALPDDIDSTFVEIAQP